MWLLILCIALISVSSISNAAKKPEKSNYVVIGAFSYIRNAERFTNYARDKKALRAEYAKNPFRNLYYVYVLVTDDRDAAIKEVLKIRNENPELLDAWVYSGALGDFDPGIQETNIQTDNDLISKSGDNSFSTDVDNPETSNSTDPTNSDQTTQDTENSENLGALSQRIEKEKEAASETLTEIEAPEPPKEIEAEPGHYYLYFNTINKQTLKEVKGRVRIIDVERAKELSLEESQQIVDIENPDNGTNRIKTSTQIFGFKEVQHIIDLENPVNDSTKSFVDTIGDSIIIDFDLERFKKGDVLVMYNVYFFKDAAVMKPDSKYELTSLLDMLQENDKLKVRIHGHTNGNAPGKIIHLDDEKNYFSLNADQKEDYGSAKKLSLYRAETIEKWLVGQGIAPSRMSAKGWGGRKMIYDKHDTQAYKNVRVEIEIVED